MSKNLINIKNNRLLKLITIILLSCTININFALGHVGYILDKEKMNSNLGMNLYFFADIFKDPINIILIISTIIIIGFAYLFLFKNKIVHKITNKLNKNSKDYYIFCAWILRLCAGITFIGAGNSHYLISSTIETTASIARGEPEKIDKAKKMLFYSLAGLIVIAVSYAIVLGVSQLQFFNQSNYGGTNSSSQSATQQNNTKQTQKTVQK